MFKVGVARETEKEGCNAKKKKKLKEIEKQKDRVLGEQTNV